MSVGYIISRISPPCPQFCPISLLVSQAPRQVSRGLVRLWTRQVRWNFNAKLHSLPCSRLSCQRVVEFHDGHTTFPCVSILPRWDTNFPVKMPLPIGLLIIRCGVSNLTRLYITRICQNRFRAGDMSWHVTSLAYLFIIYINIYNDIYILVNYGDLTATSLESWLIREIIPKLP